MNTHDVVVATEKEATDILDGLRDLIARYGEATLSDLRFLCGDETNYEEFWLGWKQLNDIAVTKVSEGYSLSLPDPISTRNP